MLAGVSEEEALEAFRDPCWRLSRFYSIRTRDDAVIKFSPHPQQREIIDLIYRQGYRSSSSRAAKSASAPCWASSVRTGFASGWGSRFR